MTADPIECLRSLPTISESLTELGRITCLLNDRDEALIREKNDLELINKIMVEANRSTTHGELFENTLKYICAHMGFDGSAAVLVNPRNKTGKIVKSVNVSDQFLEKYAKFAIDQYPYNKVFIEGRSIIGEHTRRDAPELFKKYNVLSYVIIPLISPCGIVGAILFFSRNNPVIHVHHSDILKSVARYMSDALRRIWAEINIKKEKDQYKNLYQLLRLMCDNVPDMIWAKGRDKRYIFVNKAISSNLLNALNTDEPIGKDDLYFAERERAAHPDDPNWHTFGECCRDSDEVILSELKPGRFEEHGYVKGEYLYLDVRKAPFVDLEGNVIGTVGSGRDITEEKKMSDDLSDSMINLEAHMQELKASELELQDQINQLNSQRSYFDALMEDMPIAFAYKTLDGFYKECNQAFCDTWGKIKSDIVGKTTRDVFPTDHFVIDNLDTIATKKQIKDKLHLNGKDVIVMKSPHMSESGEVLGIITCILTA